MKSKIHKIIVPVDLTPTANNVATMALTLAKATGAQLIFQHVMDPQQIAFNRATGFSDDRLLKEKIRHLKTITGRNQAKYKIQISTGNPSAEIRKLATLEKADLILVGSHDQGVLERFFLGSVSDSVVREARQSVWIVKGQTKIIKKIFVPIDGSEGSVEALETALQFARIFKAKVQPVSISEFAYQPSLSYLDPENYNRDLLKKRKSDVALWLKNAPANLLLLPTIVEMGYASSDLPRLVKKTKSDLVVMSTHSRKKMGFTLLGKVAAHMMHRSPCSVFLVRPKGWKYRAV